MSTISLRQDPRASFYAHFVRASTKRDKREYVAKLATLWARTCHQNGRTGAIMFDIDDTLIDGNECIKNGFEAMKEFYEYASTLFPVYLVTARPDSEHDRVIRMLHRKGLPIPPDRLHMLPEHLYDGPSQHVEDFKWKKFCEMHVRHNGVLIRIGDRMWDVAHRDSLHTYLSHVDDRECYVFFDTALGGCASLKLPGS